MVDEPFDLANVDVLWLAEAPNLDEIFRAVQAVESWNNYMADALDYCYQVRLVQILITHADASKMQALALHMARVADHPRRTPLLNALKKPYAAIWGAYGDILDGRISSMEQRLPPSVVERTHVREIVALIRQEKQINQQTLARRLKLGKANISRIISLLEGWEVVISQREGQGKRLSSGPRANDVPAPEAPAVAVTTQTQATSPPTKPVENRERTPVATTGNAALTIYVSQTKRSRLEQEWIIDVPINGPSSSSNILNKKPATTHSDLRH